MLRRSALWLLLVPVALAGSFLFTRVFLGNTQSPPPTPEEVRTAETLREFDRALRSHLAEYQRRARDASTDHGVALERWCQSEFQPAVYDLHHQIIQSDADAPEMLDLLHAADRLAALALNPGDPHTLERAQRAIDTAAARVKQAQHAP